MSLRRAAMTALAAAVSRDAVLPRPATVVSANPSEVAEYPAIAVLLDRSELRTGQKEDIEVRADGTPLTTDPQVGERGVGVAMLSDKLYLSRVGTLRGHGRIWVGSRLPAQREELEEKVLAAFMEDSFPGRLMVPLVGAKVGNLSLPFQWYATFTLGEEATWSDEYVFSERLWSWIRFDLDVDMLIPRNDPLMNQIILTLDADSVEPVSDQGVLIDPANGDEETLTEQEL